MPAVSLWNSPPPAPPPDQQRLIGLYGGRPAQISIFEDKGALLAEGCGFSRSPLGAAQERVRIATRETGGGGTGPCLLRLTEAWPSPFIPLGEDRLDWRDFDAAAAAFALTPKTAPVAAASQAKLPVDAGAALPDGLSGANSSAPR